MPSLIFAATSSGKGRIQPASANSAVQMTSMLMMSMDESPAASLRTSACRWVFGSLPSALKLMR